MTAWHIHQFVHHIFHFKHKLFSCSQREDRSRRFSDHHSQRPAKGPGHVSLCGQQPVRYHSQHGISVCERYDTTETILKSWTLFWAPGISHLIITVLLITALFSSTFFKIFALLHFQFSLMNCFMSFIPPMIFFCFTLLIFILILLSISEKHIEWMITCTPSKWHNFCYAQVSPSEHVMVIPKGPVHVKVGDPINLECKTGDPRSRVSWHRLDSARKTMLSSPVPMDSNALMQVNIQLLFLPVNSLSCALLTLQTSQHFCSHCSIKSFFKVIMA